MLSKTLDNNNNNSSMKAETEASQTRHKRNHIWTKTSPSNKMNMDNGDRTKTQTGHLPSHLRHSLGSAPLKKTADRTYMMMQCKGHK